VFEYAGCMVRFSMKPIEKYSVIEFNLKSEEGKAIVAENEQKYLQRLR